ncbi:MAG: TrkH family potassium uptake protein [Rhodobacteraceae bacterium]|nr:TrkH family potassium uptake protein [Paracoccaceae bacterium]
MIDLRPIFYVVGRVLVVLAILMLAPAIIDARVGLHNGADFMQAAIVTGAVGLMLSLATSNALGLGLSARQAYLMTAAIWGFVPLFGALPFMLGEPHLSFTDAYFEAVSGITTTGSTVITKLETQPPGLNLWRAMLNSLGGLGIAFVAMIFLPVLRVGGMQYFRTEGFDTFGKALPRATDIARQLVIVYFGMTLACGLTYRALGMDELSATVNAMSTIATGGFSNSDASFSRFNPSVQYAGAFFMVIASLPYIRFVQLMNGQALPLWQDSQVRAYLKWIGFAVGSVFLWRLVSAGGGIEETFREALFNLISIMSSTGFGVGSFSSWGGYVLVVAFLIGVVGACSGSSAAGLSVFRVQIAASALAAQIRQIASPSKVTLVRYEGRAVGEDVVSGLILFITGYVLLMGVMTVVLALMGLDPMSALWGVWLSIGNIGFAMGPLATRTGTLMEYPDAAKWVLILAMIMGRLGLMAVLVLFLPRFWRD